MKLGDLCEVVRGSSPRPKSDTRFYGGNVPRLMVSDLTRDGKIVSARTDTLTELGAKQSRPMKSGDIVIAVSGAPGLPAILSHDCCIHDGFVGLRDLDRGRLNADFLYAYLMFVKETSISQAVGAIFKNLTTDQIKAIEIPEIPLCEQNRIAEVLDRAEALRAKRRAALALLDELTQSIFLDMFGDPVSNPRGWPTRAFDDVCASRLGKMLDAKKQVGDNPRPYMRNINVQWGKLDLSTVWEMDFNEKDRQEFRLLPNDVLICEGGAGVAQTAVWRGEIAECYFQKSLHRVRPKPCSATSEYIAFLIRMLMRKGSDLFRLVSSATIPHLTGVKLKTLGTPVPPLDLQCRFGLIIESVAQQKARMQAHVAELDQLFASLRHRAFRGEL